MFEPERTFDLLMLIVFLAVIYYGIYVNEKGKVRSKIRKLAAIDAIEEAIGSAAERGKSALFAPRGGLSAGKDIPQTLSFLTILGKIARHCGENDVPLIISYSQSEADAGILMEAVIRENFLLAGNIELFKADTMRFFGRSSTPSTIAILHKERPGAVFYFGSYYAESLLLTQGARRVGAITCGGTNNTAQMPYMMVTLDHMLIGEELFAAGAYISQEPSQVGSIQGNDWGKMIVLLLIIIGTLLSSVGISSLIDLMSL